jgi:hypothetical protein
MMGRLTMLNSRAKAHAKNKFNKKNKSGPGKKRSLRRKVVT